VDDDHVDTEPTKPLSQRSSRGLPQMETAEDYVRRMMLTHGLSPELVPEESAAAEDQQAASYRVYYGEDDSRKSRELHDPGAEFPPHGHVDQAQNSEVASSLHKVTGERVETAEFQEVFLSEEFLPQNKKKALKQSSAVVDSPVPAEAAFSQRKNLPSQIEVKLCD